MTSGTAPKTAVAAAMPEDGEVYRETGDKGDAEGEGEDEGETYTPGPPDAVGAAAADVIAKKQRMKKPRQLFKSFKEPRHRGVQHRQDDTPNTFPVLHPEGWCRQRWDQIQVLVSAQAIIFSTKSIIFSRSFTAVPSTSNVAISSRHSSVPSQISLNERSLVHFSMEES